MDNILLHRSVRTNRSEVIFFPDNSTNCVDSVLACRIATVLLLHRCNKTVYSAVDISFLIFLDSCDLRFPISVANYLFFRFPLISISGLCL